MQVQIGLGGLLFIIFLILKLTGTGAIALWSWWWVTSPLWIPMVIAFCVFLFLMFVAVIAAMLK
ncbi:MAG: hypothetical protein PHY47_01075 [Lachnospiraceae bacterium]|nr:hypothetical protein [Lachnospiraceae bacterium]